MQMVITYFISVCAGVCCSIFISVHSYQFYTKYYSFMFTSMDVIIMQCAITISFLITTDNVWSICTSSSKSITPSSMRNLICCMFGTIILLHLTFLKIIDTPREIKLSDIIQSHFLHNRTRQG